jgi:hypothetical protein
MPTTATLTTATAVTNGGYSVGTTHTVANGSIGAITLTSSGTGYTTSTTPYITVTGGGGGGGSGGYMNQVLTTNTGGTTSWNTGGREVMRISADGDIFQGGSTNADDGLFARLERLERLMGIMRRDRSLERDYEPMRQLGDAYDDAVDAAISEIMEVTLGKLAHMEQEYESMREQAKVWRALSKDDD